MVNQLIVACIPAFNEEQNLASVVTKVSKFADKIIVCDDGSTDMTREIAVKLGCDLVVHSRRLGKGVALKDLFEKALDLEGDIIVTIDGDGQNNPKDIINLLEIFYSKKVFSLVGGIRSKRKDSLIKVTSSIIANNIRSIILKDNCVDTGCSLKVFDKDVFLSFPYFDGLHRFLPALFKGFGKKTFFVKVDHRSRIYGISKYGILGRLFKGVFDIIRVITIIRNSKFKD